MIDLHAKSQPVFVGLLGLSVGTVLWLGGCKTQPQTDGVGADQPAQAVIQPGGNANRSPESPPAKARSAESAAAPSNEPRSRGGEGYGLQPGDIISVSVWQDPALNQLVMVRPDGGISFPLAGDLQAQGRTVSELTGDLAKRLSTYIPDAVVTVSLQEIPGNRIYILGRVNKPGDFVIARDVTIMQALAMAGGLTPFANESQIKVLRYENGRQRTLPFNYKQVEQGRHLEQDVLLQAGDVIVIP